MGDIGKAFARRLKGFNTNIMYHNRTRRPDDEEALGALYVPFETLLKESDFIVCSAPQTIKSLSFNKASNETYKDRKSTRLNSSHVSISYAFICYNKRNTSTLTPT